MSSNSAAVKGIMNAASDVDSPWASIASTTLFVKSAATGLSFVPLTVIVIRSVVVWLTSGVAIAIKVRNDNIEYRDTERIRRRVNRERPIGG